MNSFQVDQVRSLGNARRRFGGALSIFVSVTSAVIIGSFLSLISGNSVLIGFAQNLPASRQVLGDKTISTLACTGEPYRKPGSVPLGGAGTGVTVINDTPQFYSVYGRSINELRQSVDDCEVRKQSGEFHALTTYVLNWQYDVRAYDGQCTLDSIKVGVRTNQYLPRLAENQPLAGTEKTQWNAYYASLVAHENEHVALNEKHARDLYNSLENLQSACGTIDANVQMITATYVQILNGANDLLDTQTNHGADTGAVL